MRTPFDHQALQDYIVERAYAQGIEGRPALAEAAGFHPSRLSKWYSGGEQPSVDNLLQLSRSIGASFPKLLVLAGWCTAEDLELNPADLDEDTVMIDPLARELGEMLDEDSKLPQDRRERLRTTVDSLMQVERPAMKRRRRAS